LVRGAWTGRRAGRGGDQQQQHWQQEEEGEVERRQCAVMLLEALKLLDDPQPAAASLGYGRISFEESSSLGSTDLSCGGAVDQGSHQSSSSSTTCTPFSAGRSRGQMCYIVDMQRLDR
jgi:hypothetical protein